MCAYKKKWMTDYIKRKPWFRHYKSAHGRCRSEKCGYKRRGIKFLMNLNDFEKLWFRDKAYLLEHPSIDRIDTKGNYIFENCRFIELRENKARAQRKPVIQMDLNKKVINMFSSAKEAGEQTKSNANSIQLCCRGELKKTNNYKWRWAE